MYCVESLALLNGEIPAPAFGLLLFGVDGGDAVDFGTSAFVRAVATLDSASVKVSRLATFLTRPL